MINDFNKIIQEAINKKDYSYFATKIEYLTNKYSVCEKTIYNRFKSIFKMSPREYIIKNIFPSRQEIIEILLESSNSKMFFETLNLPNNLTKGIFDRYFSVSTFKKARLKILSEKLDTNYVPIREDNRSIIYSQLLGDGSYNKKSHGLRIIHGEKQIPYLKWKVSMLNKAYPKTSSIVNIRTHKQGHIYGDYYTPLGNIDIISELEAITKLTNFGWLLWFLDDGSYNQNISICCKRDKKLRLKAIDVLKTFDIDAREDGTSIICKGKENDLKFFYNFIKPFLSDIPKCMLYKVEDIVEMSDISLSAHRK